MASESRSKVPAVDQGLGEGVVLLGRAVAPVDGVGLGQIGDLPDPVEELGVRGRRCGRGGLARHSRHSLLRYCRLDGLRPTRLTSASSLRIFSVAVCCLPSGENHRASRTSRPVSTSTSDGQSTVVDLRAESIFPRSLSIASSVLALSITVSPQPATASEGETTAASECETHRPPHGGPAEYPKRRTASRRTPSDRVPRR